MPCYQVNLISVEFKAKNKDILLRALQNLGINFTYYEERQMIRLGLVEIDLRNQTVEAPNYSFSLVNEIKRQYSQEVIQEVAKKKRWIIKQMQGNKLQLKKY